jgi:hypothetical protein
MAAQRSMCGTVTEGAAPILLLVTEEPCVGQAIGCVDAAAVELAAAMGHRRHCARSGPASSQPTECPGMARVPPVQPAQLPPGMLLHGALASTTPATDAGGRHHGESLQNTAPPQLGHLGRT